MDSGELVPDDAQHLRAVGDLDAHQGLNGLGIAHGMAERADAADSLDDVDELVVVARLDELLKASVHEADLRDGLDDLLVLDHEVQMERLRQHRVLRAERDDGRFSHATPPSLRARPSRPRALSLPPWPRAPSRPSPGPCPQASLRAPHRRKARPALGRRLPSWPSLP